MSKFGKTMFTFIFLCIFFFQTCKCRIEVANGHLSLPHMFPHTVEVICKKVSDDPRDCNLEHYCGGGLINENTVLIAAHCISNDDLVRDATTLTVQIGTTDVSKREYGIIAKGKSVIVHPRWIPAKVDKKYINDYDIALLTIDKSIPENGKTVRYMDISPWPIEKVGKRAVVSGWGFYDKSFKRDYKLRYAIVPVREGEVCEQKKLSFSPDIMICAGDGKVDSCHGDSGAPLVLLNEGVPPKRWTSIGIVSFGTSFRCGSDDSYGVYTKVSAFYDWILNHTHLPPPPSENMTILPHLELLNGTLAEKFVVDEVPDEELPENWDSFFSHGTPLALSIVFGCCTFLCMISVLSLLLLDSRFQIWRARERKVGTRLEIGDNEVDLHADSVNVVSGNDEFDPSRMNSNEEAKGRGGSEPTEDQSEDLTDEM